MKNGISGLAVLGLALAACLACAQVTQTVEEEVLLGVVTRAEIEEAQPDWVAATVEAEPEYETAFALADLATTARVTVFFGSWCSDSKRELSRLWAALDLVGGEAGFPIDYVAVDRSKEEPASLVAGREILYVPTLIVEQDDHEIGRIVEQAPASVETDLLAILEGSASGWISARTDLPVPSGGGSS